MEENACIPSLVGNFFLKLLNVRNSIFVHKSRDFCKSLKTFYGHANIAQWDS